MASKAAPAVAGHVGSERSTSSAMRTIADILVAVGEGFRARKEYRELVGNGVEPATAAAEAIQHAENR